MARRSRRTAEMVAIDVEIGYRLRRARMERGLTQTELGALLGLTFQQIQKYENGQNRLSCSMMVMICRALELPATYFFDERPAKAEPSTSDRMLMELHKAARESDHDVVREVTKLLRARRPMDPT